MTRNPFLNALAAAIYIVIVALVMFYGPQLAGEHDGVIVPIAVISLFTLSAAVMGYLFLHQPFRMYFDGDKKTAVNLFLKTVATFAGITILILLGLFSGIL